MGLETYLRHANTWAKDKKRHSSSEKELEVGREKRRGRRSQKFDAAGRPSLVNSPGDALFTELNVP